MCLVLKSKSLKQHNKKERKKTQQRAKPALAYLFCLLLPNPNTGSAEWNTKTTKAKRTLDHWLATVFVLVCVVVFGFERSRKLKTRKNFSSPFASRKEGSSEQERSKKPVLCAMLLVFVALFFFPSRRLFIPPFRGFRALHPFSRLFGGFCD